MKIPGQFLKPAITMAAVAIAAVQGASIASAPALAEAAWPSEKATIAPEIPVSFGYKCQWLALKGAKPDAVIKALGLKHVQSSGWETGVHAAYEGKYFVSPPANGWVFVVSNSLPDTGGEGRPNRIAPLVKQLSSDLKCVVHYYGTHRVGEYHAWIWAEQGRIRRGFSFTGESGSIEMNEGTPTPVELSRKLVFKDVDDLFAKERFPDEEDVMAVAAQWSVNPMLLGESHKKVGKGFLGDGR